MNKDLKEAIKKVIFDANTALHKNKLVTGLQDNLDDDVAATIMEPILAELQESCIKLVELLEDTE